MSLTRLLITTDAIGGVWRYTLDLARGLAPLGVETVILGFGPEPGADQRREAGAVAELHWSGLPLDWMVEEAALAGVPDAIREAARAAGADAVQVNLPSQAAGLRGLPDGLPVIAVAHSCTVTWHAAVHGGALPADWEWQRRLNAAGFEAADAVVAPSRSHGALMARCYRGLTGVHVVPNAAAPAPVLAAALGPAPQPKEPFAYAAARWWDAGKNAPVLDAAAGRVRWPVLALGESRGPDGQRFAFRHARALGQQSHAELRSFAARASVFVSPSLYEPFGLAALEAAGAGAALVLSDIPTYREIWEGAALFADPQDRGGFAKTLDRLAGDAALCRQMGDLAAERAARFTPERQARAMLGLYRAAATAPRARAEAI